jgi:hypothetical protein
MPLVAPAVHSFILPAKSHITCPLVKVRVRFCAKVWLVSPALPLASLGSGTKALFGAPSLCPEEIQPEPTVPVLQFDATDRAFWAIVNHSASVIK